MKIKLGILFLAIFGILMIGACVPYIPVYPPTYTPGPYPTQPQPTPTSPWVQPTPTPTQVVSIPKWTVMVYIDGDNNLEPNAIEDLNEMEMVGSTSSVNVVVQIDRIPGYDTSNGDWTGARRYYVTKDYDPYTINSTLIQDLGEVNMGSPQTLIDFVNWATTNYPANHYALIIWNHGGGFRKNTRYPLTKDIAIDDTSNDAISMPQLSYALSRISTLLGKRIDLFGMDACLMSMIEVAYEIKDYANVMVSSEENEPLDGWPYSRILTPLISNPSMSASALGSQIVNNFVAFYQGTENVTLSAIDLSKIGSLASLVSQFASAVINDNLTNTSQYIYDANSTEYYGDQDFIDLYDFASIIVYDPYIYSASAKNLAGSIMSGIQNAVIAKGATFDITYNNGISIYFPYTPPIDARYPLTRFAQNTYWDEMLQHLGF